MSAQNQVTLIGRLLRDPEMDEVGKDKKYLKAKLALAVRKGRRKKNSSSNEPDADFIDGIVAWGKQAEFAENYLVKGRMIAINGELVPERWKDKDNNNRYRLTIRADSVQSLDSKKKN